MAKFQKGNPGRPRGTKNKLPFAIKEAVLLAAEEAHEDGMKGYLIEQAHKNPNAFMGLLGKILPMKVEGDLDQKLIVEIRKFD